MCQYIFQQTCIICADTNVLGKFAFENLLKRFEKVFIGPVFPENRTRTGKIKYYFAPVCCQNFFLYHAKKTRHESKFCTQKVTWMTVLVRFLESLKPSLSFKNRNTSTLEAKISYKT